MAITRLANNDLLTPTRIPSARGGAIPQGPQFNAATGGSTTTDVSNYNGTGQTWRVHRFNASGSFSVTTSVQPFTVLVVGAGGAGASNGGNSGPAGGSGGGGFVVSQSIAIPTATNVVTVGVASQANPAASSSIGSLVSAQNGANGVTSSQVAAGPSNLTSSTITGTSANYAGQGSPGGWCSPNCSGGGGDMPNNPGAGQAGERGGQGNCCYGPIRHGNDGVVIIAYRIA